MNILRATIVRNGLSSACPTPLTEPRSYSFFDARMAQGWLPLAFQARLNCAALLDYIALRLLRLSPGLDDDIAFALDFDVQDVPIEQQHTQERSAASRVSLDVSRLAVPQNRNVVNAEAHFIIVGQKSSAFVSKG